MDILIEPFIPEFGTKCFRFGRDSSGLVKASSGIIFLAQRVITAFFTGKGSDYLEPDKGTKFAEVVSTGVSSEEELAEIATVGLLDVYNYIKRAQASERNLETDEILATLSLESLSLLDSSIEMVIQVRSLDSSNATVNVILPS